MDKTLRGLFKIGLRKAINEFVGDMSQIKEILKENVTSTLSEKDDNRGEQILLRMQALQAEMIDINRKKRTGEIAYELYIAKAQEIADEVEKLEREQKEIQSKENDRLAETKRLKDILEVINEMHPTDEFDGEMFRRLIDNVIVKGNQLTFNFKVGIVKTATI